MQLLSWIAATAAVLGLILLLGRGLQWLGRGTESGAAARQRAQWRIAPDARVRAVEVLGRVHLVYERGRESLVLESLEAAHFQSRGGDAPPRPAVVALARGRFGGGR